MVIRLPVFLVFPGMGRRAAMNQATHTDNVVIRLSAEEAQKALAIGMDEDAEEALSFLK